MHFANSGISDTLADLSKSGRTIPDQGLVAGLIDIVTRIEGVSEEELRTSRRSQVAHIRGAIWAVLREQDWQWAAIGDEFERDHSSVANMVLKIHRFERINPDYAYLIQELRRYARTAVRVDGGLEARTRASIAGLEREIAWAEALRADLDARIEAAQRQYEALRSRLTLPVP